jgi:LuxR family maltose regulon positive regulatory protein
VLHTPDRHVDEEGSREGFNVSSALCEIDVEIVRALAHGLQSKEISAILGRSRATIELRVRSLYAKLNAKTRAQIVSRAYEAGILSAQIAANKLAVT